MRNIKQRVYEIIGASNGNDLASSLYDAGIMIAIVASLVPLAFKEQTEIFFLADWITTGIFVADYILRWWTADYKFGDKSAKSYIKYPFSFMAIVALPSSIITAGYMEEMMEEKKD